MEFKQTIEYMDPMQVTDYLQKILVFLKKDMHEVCFPNISPYVEAFLVSLVTNTTNLKCESFSNENKRFAAEILEVLEKTKDTFRWTYTHVNGKLTKKLLMYKKIYCNKKTKSRVENNLTSQLNQHSTNQMANKHFPIPTITWQTKQHLEFKKRKCTPSDMRRRENRAAIFARAGLWKPTERQETSTVESSPQPNLCLSLDGLKHEDTQPKTGQSLDGLKHETVTYPSEASQDQFCTNFDTQTVVKIEPKHANTSEQCEQNHFHLDTQSTRLLVKIERTTTSDLNKVDTRKDLFVAVMTEPFTDLTPDQVDSIKAALEACIENIPSHAGVYWPSFRGKPFHSDGVLKLQCEDRKDVKWLEDTVATLASPIPDTILVVRRQTYIPKRIKSAVLLRNCSEEIEKLKHILAGQNKWYEISKWSVYHVKRYNDRPASFVVLGIPVEQIPTILERGRRLSYKLSDAYIRFFDSLGRLQDIPPNESVEKQNSPDRKVMFVKSQQPGIQ